MSTHLLEDIFNPRSIAVVGASGNPHTMGYRFAASLLEYGYQGNVYPINPNHSEILGIKTYRRVQDIPGPVDYVISCIPAPKVPSLMEDCCKKGVKAVHLFTARFSETGRQEAAELEQEILRKAKNGGVRIIGPNCMGLYFPRKGISFSDAMPKKSGTVALISQSGQVAEELCRYVALREVYFSKAISYGNAIDFNECDFLDYFAQDSETKVILMYVEGIRDGKRFVKAVRHAAAKKPVVILKGGKSKSGTRATASHTASMAGSQEIWKFLVTQSGAVAAKDLDELADLAVAFQFLPPIMGLRVGVAGGGGGASVLSADTCEAMGLEVIPLPSEMREELKSRGSTIWDWIGNPADMSIGGGPDSSPGEILQMMARYRDFDFLIALMMEPHHEHQKGIPAESYLNRLKLNEPIQKPVLVVIPDKSLGIDSYDSWAWKVLCEVRTKLLAARIPFYPTIGRAATAAKKLVKYYQRRSQLQRI